MDENPQLMQISLFLHPYLQSSAVICSHLRHPRIDLEKTPASFEFAKYHAAYTHPRHKP